MTIDVERLEVADGKTIELLTPLSDANRDADAKAFAVLTDLRARANVPVV